MYFCFAFRQCKVKSFLSYILSVKLFFIVIPYSSYLVWQTVKKGTLHSQVLLSAVKHIYSAVKSDKK